MGSVDSLLRKIRMEAEGAAEEQIQDVRFVRTCGPKDEIRQGDVYLYRLQHSPQTTGELETRQLAEGETSGSRHIVVDHAALFHRPTTDPLEGPFLLARERCVIEHPEHAHISIPPGWYEVRYQRDFSVRHARLSRVQD